MLRRLAVAVLALAVALAPSSSALTMRKTYGKIVVHNRTAAPVWLFVDLNFDGLFEGPFTVKAGRAVTIHRIPQGSTVYLGIDRDRDHFVDEEPAVDVYERRVDYDVLP
jgi:hypothetical protein